MKFKFQGGSTHSIASITREGRPCGLEGITQILNQIGRMNVLAVSGGRVGPLETEDGEKVGVFLPITHDRRVEVVLTVMDTYRVTRSRYLKKGKDAGTEVIEESFDDVYADEVGEIVYQASCWK